MDAGRWRQVGAVFESAADLRTAEEQQVFLAEACGDDDELRCEVERLLVADEQPGGWLDRPICRLPDPGRIEDRGLVDRRIGAYRLLCKLAEGGMGTVYLAERDDHEYRRQVAVKVVRGDLTDPDLLRRFRNERQILAALEHPGIARLYDGGTTEDGHPFLVMEYLAGRPIHEHCDRGALTIDQRLKLFLEVCAAVSHAHGLQVIHRDIKPSNVLVTNDGHPKLLDFGIATGLHHGAGQQGVALEATVVDQRPFTPGYASPEQVRGQAVTPASDQYALGVLLYELLTSVSPYRLKHRSGPEVMRAICEQEIEKPSRAVGARPEVALNRATTPAGLKRCLAGDLDNIILKALQKEPQERYGSVEHLALDLRCYLQGQPVLARPSSRAYRMKKLIHRHPIRAVLLILLVLVIAIFVFAHDRQNQLIEHQQARGQAVERELTDFLIKVPDQVAVQSHDRNVVDHLIPRLRASASDLRTQATLLDSLGQVYQLAGMAKPAHGFFSDALNLRRQLPVRAADELADSLHHLGSAETSLGRLADGGSLLQQALELRENIEGQRLSVARSKEALALNHWAKGDLEAAERLLLEAVEIRDCECGEDDNYWVADTMDHLAALYTRSGRFREAEAWMASSLEARRSLPRSPGARLASLDQQATLYFARGQFEEAEWRFRQVLAERRARVTDLRSSRQSSALSGLDRALSESLHDLARCLGESGAYEEAELSFAESLAIARQLYTDDHPFVLTLLNNLAVVLGNKGDDAAAQALFLQVLERRERLFGEEHPHVGQVHYSLGHLLHQRGVLDPAERHYRKAESLLRKTLPSDHPAQAYPQVALGRLALDRGEAYLAENLLRGALEHLRASHAPGHWRIAEASHLLGASVAARGPTAEAVELMREGAEVLRQQRGERAPRTVQALARLATYAREVF